MKLNEITELRIKKVDNELPWRVEIIGETKTHGAGVTLVGALMIAFHVSDMFLGDTEPEFLLWLRSI